MIDPEKMRLFMQALKPDLPGLARQVFIENPQTAWRELPGKLQNYSNLLQQDIERRQAGQPIDPVLLDKLLGMTGFAPMGMTANVTKQAATSLLDQPTAEMTERLYHGTSPAAAKQIERSGFDINKSADGTVWFTSNPQIGEVAATNKGAVVERLADLNKLKLGGWKETDKYSVDELIQQGYDGLRLVDGNEITYQIFNPEKLRKPLKK